MIQVLLFFFISLITFGCGPRYIDYFPRHDDGAVKPIVALLPVVDASELNLFCDLSAELTHDMRYEIRNEGEFYLLPPREIQMHLAQIGKIDFLSDDLLAQHFCNANFIILTELISHDSISSEPGACAWMIKNHPDRETLKVSMRIKIIDIRYPSPYVVLQEVVTSDYPIRKKDLEVELNELESDPQNYQTSSIGRAHDQLISAVVRRIEEVIRSAF